MCFRVRWGFKLVAGRVFGGEAAPPACDFYLRVRRKLTNRIRGERGFKMGGDYREGPEVVVDRVGPTRILSCIRYVGLKTLIISRFIAAVDSVATAVPAHELSRYMPQSG